MLNNYSPFFWCELTELRINFHFLVWLIKIKFVKKIFGKVLCRFLFLSSTALNHNFSRLRLLVLEPTELFVVFVQELLQDCEIGTQNAVVNTLSLQI